MSVSTGSGERDYTEINWPLPWEAVVAATADFDIPRPYRRKLDEAAFAASGSDKATPYQALSYWVRALFALPAVTDGSRVGYGILQWLTDDEWRQLIDTKNPTFTVTSGRYVAICVRPDVYDIEDDQPVKSSKLPGNWFCSRVYNIRTAYRSLSFKASKWIAPQPKST